MSQPDLSVIIPVYNRGEIIRYTFESVRRASERLTVETIVVDDGSSPPAADMLARLGLHPSRLVRQDNQGLLFARLAGLAQASGYHVLFLDSDDLVGPEKFRRQIAAMNATGAEISYSDSARCVLEGDYDRLAVVPDGPAADTADATEFCLEVQPAPHSPIFLTAWLKEAVAQAFFPPSPLYNCVAEIWFYHNAAPRAGQAVRVPGPHTIVGLHPGARLTNHWERLAVASLAVMEAFARACPDTPDAPRAQQLVAEAAFRSWRKLPRNFNGEFCERILGLWRKLGPGRRQKLGENNFQIVARILGPATAGRLLRCWQAKPYASCRTLPDEEVERLLRAIPPP
ncbi:MAG TPA: glycosyltransferase family 2 protein [Opitutaceae bacterium]|nr:glycosyltransferase family 2 protein [Opitutaceae bacterium]